MDTRSHEGEARPWAGPVAAWLARAFENRAVIRLGAVIAVLWLWLTLLGFTLGASREILSLLIGRSLYASAAMGSLADAVGGLTATVSLIFTAISVLTVVPGVLAWNELLHLARIIGHLIITAVNWEAEDDETEVQVLRLQRMLEDAATFSCAGSVGSP